MTLLAMGVAAVASPLDTGVRSISLERDCGGCAQAGRITLSRDDTLTWTRLGHARLGTQDQTLSGHLRPGSFSAISVLFMEKSFFSLADEYADPGLADGPWSLLIVERSDGSVKQVFRRGDAGPALLQELESAVSEAAADTQLRDAPR
ncbi:MAG: hypothetical protein DI603_02605 [Roseateles depolymerans]|uniref:Uncharacterized protein n=1 Tax=Roseateles depolymerans TaxID=76731 RepID=A0A2W5DUT3_9BURK|nr:MAG: hypothetical protein DI603_02605 [Roseateles depolymerans]